MQLVKVMMFFAFSALVSCGGGSGDSKTIGVNSSVSSSLAQSVSSSSALPISSVPSNSISTSSSSSLVQSVSSSSALPISSVPSNSISTSSSSSLVQSVSSSSVLSISSVSSSSISTSSTSPKIEATKIKMRVTAADDYVYLTVNGIRHRVGYWGQQENMGTWLDITSWFKKGNNDVLLQGMNNNGPGEIGFDLQVDGKYVLSAQCYAGSCGQPKSLGIFYESRVAIADVKLPESGRVLVSGAQSGQIYINDEYVGASPREFTLAPGTYKIGYGVSNDNLMDMNDAYYEDYLALGKLPSFSLTGKFYEVMVDVAERASISVAPDVISTPLPPQNTVKIALLPFKSVMSKEMKSPLVLTQQMVNEFAQQIQASSNLLALPTMYGLSKWEVTVLPMDETLNVNAETNAGIVSALYNTQYLPAYKSIYDTYDVVVLYQSSYHQDGSVEPIFAGGMTSGGPVIHVTSGWTWTLPFNALNRGFYHEMYHQYEFWEADLYHYYRGLNGLHGQREHGFTGSGDSVQHYYRLYARGQVGEDLMVSSGFDWPTPLVGGHPNPVGVFHAVRYGRPSRQN